MRHGLTLYQSSGHFLSFVLPLSVHAQSLTGLYSIGSSLGNNSSPGSNHSNKTATRKAKNSSLTSNQKGWRGINDENQIKMVAVHISIHARDEESLGSTG